MRCPATKRVLQQVVLKLFFGTRYRGTKAETGKGVEKAVEAETASVITKDLAEQWIFMMKCEMDREKTTSANVARVIIEGHSGSLSALFAHL